MSELTRELAELSAQWIVEETLVTIPPGGGPAVQLVTQDPTRWYLAFSFLSAQGTGINVSTNPNVNNSLSQGLPITTEGFVEFHYRSSGGLAQSAWYASPGNVQAQISIFEVRLQQ